MYDSKTWDDLGCESALSAALCASSRCHPAKDVYNVFVPRVPGSYPLLWSRVRFVVHMARSTEQQFPSKF